MIQNLNDFAPYTATPFTDLVPQNVNPSVLATLLYRLCEPLQISDPHTELVLAFANCSPAVGRLLVTSVGADEDFTLSEHIQRVSKTLEPLLSPVNPETRLLLRLWNLVHDGFKGACYLNTKHSRNQAEYNQRFVQDFLSPAIKRSSFVPQPGLLDGLYLLCGQDIVGKAAQYYTRRHQKIDKARVFDPEEAQNALRSFAAVFPTPWRYQLAYILRAAFYADLKAYTSHVTHVDASGREVKDTSLGMDKYLKGSTLVLADAEAQAAVDELLTLI